MSLCPLNKIYYNILLMLFLRNNGQIVMVLWICLLVVSWLWSRWSLQWIYWGMGERCCHVQDDCHCWSQAGEFFEKSVSGSILVVSEHSLQLYLMTEGQPPHTNPFAFHQTKVPAIANLQKCHKTTKTTKNHVANKFRQL